MARKRRSNGAGQHPRRCLCKGTSMLPAAAVAHGNGRTYENVSRPCPGMPAPPPPEPERQRAAAGDREDA